MESIVSIEAQQEETVITEVTKRAKPAKKARKVASVKVLTCGRCGLPTTHTLYDSTTKLYKCNICGECHQK